MTSKGIFNNQEEYLIKVGKKKFLGRFTKEDKRIKEEVFSRKETIIISLPSFIVDICTDMAEEKKRAVAVKKILIKIMETEFGDMENKGIKDYTNIKRKGNEPIHLSLQSSDVDACSKMFPEMERRDAVKEVIRNFIFYL